MIEAMLAGEPDADGLERTRTREGSGGAKASPSPKRPAASTAPTKAAPRPTPTPVAADDPHAGTKMSPTDSMAPCKARILD